VSRYRYKAVPRFWRSYARLTAAQQASAKAVWQIFRNDPFDPRLRAHKIHRLSAAAGRTVWAVEIEGDLRAVFTIEGNIVTTLDVGSHAIYKP
jgi:mRNA-degrading endonuclease YafQ of YafQ-DinJ toxin-antitoxin module